ncbi:MAG: MFS transporter [Candidatus Eremiobacteraeota bacterium]|nr:MFS transporter [Candidatus Eremiobacteraeota bacterium]MBC5827514.1 MFS transporter [Candidatus Eremiobacteraeota bacterium]
MNRRLLGVLSLGHLAVDVVAGALPAILPYLQREFGLSYLMLGAVMMTSNVTSSIVQPVFGAVSDRAPARYLLPVGVLLAVSGFASLGMVGSFPMILVGVAISGIGSAIYHPEASKSAHYVAGRRTATGMSIFSVGGNVGTALGPLLLTALIGWGGLEATRVLFVPAFAAAAVVMVVLPGIARAQQEHRKRTLVPPQSGRRGTLTQLVVIVGLRAFVYGGLLTFAPLYAVNVLHASVAGNGPLLFIVLASGAVATALTGTIADRFGKKPTLLVSFALAPATLTAYLLTTGPLALIALALTGACLIGTFALTVVMGQELLPHRLALASALMIGLTTGIGGLGVAALGRVADLVGLAAAMWCLVAAAAAAFVLALWLPGTAARSARLAADVAGAGALAR